MSATPDRPTVKLLGSDGNAFAILGRVKRAATNAGWIPRSGRHSRPKRWRVTMTTCSAP